MYLEPTIVKPSFSSPQSPTELTVSGGLLYYRRGDISDTFTSTLWRTDGTDAGTIAVKATKNEIDGLIGNLADINETLYFKTSSSFIEIDGITYPQSVGGLWRTDGTAENTIQVQLNNLAPTSATNINLGNLTRTGKSVYFTTNNNKTLWKTDSLLENAIVVQSFDLSIKNRVGTQEELFFTTGFDQYSQEESFFWKTDGTAQGTSSLLVDDQSWQYLNVRPIVTDVVFVNNTISYITAPIPNPTEISSFFNLNNTLYFRANDPVQALWKFDVTSQKIRVVEKDEYYGAFTPFNDRFIFVHYTDRNGTELWQSDGTRSGASLFKDLWPDPDYLVFPNSSNPSDLINVNGTLFFTANDGIHGRELWKIDSVSEEVILVKDIYPGTASSVENNLINVNGVLYFIANDGIHGSELWRSDGTSEGTQLVKDIRTLPNTIVLPDGSSYDDFSSAINDLTLVNGTLYFTAFDDTNEGKLWKIETPRSELLARNTDTGEVALLYLNQQNQVQQRSGLTYGAAFGAQAGQPANVSVDWKIAATADVDRNGVADLLTYNAAKDEVAIWNLGQNGKVDGIRSLVSQNGQILRTGNRDWQVIGMADIDQDGNLDVVWHNPVSDEVAFWFMQSDGAIVREYDYLRDATGAVLKTGNPKWRIEGMSDFDRDGDMDLLFRLGDLNQTAIVRLNGRIVTDAQYVDAAPNNNLQFRRTVNQQVYWQSADNQQVVIQDLLFRSGKWESKFKSIASSGQLQGLVDLDGNGMPEMIFRNSLTNGLQFSSTDARQAAKPLQQKNQTFQFGSGNWAVIQTADFGNVVAV